MMQCLLFKKMCTLVPKVKFSDGHECPIIGIGTWKLPLLHQEGYFNQNPGRRTGRISYIDLSTKSKPGEVTQAVKDAIDIGYRHIDCAFVYGNEKEVGEAITAKIDECVVKREDLFITSKLWNTFHRPDLVKGALEESLKNLNLKFLDLYLIHWPQAYKEGESLFPVDACEKIQFSDADYVETWKAMEPLRAEGLVKSIGISNFNARQMQRVMENSTVKPVVNQVECHPYLTQKELHALCTKLGVVLEAYSPLGSPDRPWAKPDDPRLLDDKRLLTIAEKLKRSVAQILIRYHIDRGNVVIPKSVTRSRIAENFAVFDFSLSASDLELVDSFNCGGRFVPMTESLGHKDHPFEKDKF